MRETMASLRMVHGAVERLMAQIRELNAAALANARLCEEHLAENTKLANERDRANARVDWLEKARSTEITARDEAQAERDEARQHVSMLEADLGHVRAKLGMAEALVVHLRAEKARLEHGVVALARAMGDEVAQPPDPFAFDRQAMAFEYAPGRGSWFPGPR